MVKVEIGFDTASELVIQVLKEDYLAIKESLGDPIFGHKNDPKTLKGIKRIFKYHMTPDDYKAWKKEVKA